MTEPRCPSILLVGDDQGDNHATMRCGLLDGHAGEHLEKGNIEGNAFEIRWSGDMRRTCERCGGRTESTTLCWNQKCLKELCGRCVFRPEGRERIWSDDRCPECPDPSDGP